MAECKTTAFTFSQELPWFVFSMVVAATMLLSNCAINSSNPCSQAIVCSRLCNFDKWRTMGISTVGTRIISLGGVGLAAREEFTGI
jgi:hypothetical protein